MQRAASAAGLSPRTDAQIDAIESRIASTMRRLAHEDPEWQAKTPGQRLEAAAEAAMADIQAKAAKKVSDAELQALKTAEVESRLSARVARGSDRTHAVVADLEQTQRYINGTRNEAMSGLMDLIDAVRSGAGASGGRRAAMFLFDVENPAMTEDLAAEIFRNADGSTGNTIAKEGAAAYLKVAEQLRQRFNAAGGNVGQLDYGYLAQPWDAAKVRKVGVDRFVAAVLPNIDRSRMLREDGARMTDAEVSDFLRAAWDTLRTEGLNKTEPGGFRGSGARANRGSDHRQIHFRDGEAYLAVMKELGRGSMYDAISGHISAMARDIGLVERYGPNPNAQFRLQLDLAERADGAGKRVFGMRPQTYWDVLSGVTATPQSANIAQIGMAVRAIETAGKLGGALLSSVTDIGTYFVSTGFNKLGYWQSFANIGRTMAKDTREFMAAHMIIAESMTADLNRWAGDNTSQNWAGRLANSTLRLSLLTAWTDTLRRGFQLSMMQGMARLAKTDWDALPQWERALLERRGGFTPDDWSIIRKAELTELRGLDHLTPGAIRDAGGDGALVSKVLGYLQDEAEFGVINPDLATRAAVTLGGTQAGTYRGEAARAVMQFKAFPVAMVSRHWRRMLEGSEIREGITDGSAPILANRLAYGGALILTTTALGALAVQAKQMLMGKDPIDMTGDHFVKFWMRALAQGGGLSIVGDLLLNDPADEPGGAVAKALKTVTGPAFGSAGELVFKLIGENIWQEAKGKDSHFAAEAITWAKAHAPFINIWYAKAAIEHMVFHAIQENLSPGYLSRMKQRANRDWDQKFWWAPGEQAPARAPDLPKAVGR